METINKLRFFKNIDLANALPKTIDPNIFYGQRQIGTKQNVFLFQTPEAAIYATGILKIKGIDTVAAISETETTKLETEYKRGNKFHFLSGKKLTLFPDVKILLCEYSEGNYMGFSHGEAFLNWEALIHEDGLRHLIDVCLFEKLDDLHAQSTTFKTAIKWEDLFANYLDTGSDFAVTEYFVPLARCANTFKEIEF